MSDDLDPTALLGEPTAQEQAAAYAAALRRQAFSGSLGSLLGNKGLADFGNHVTQTAEHDADALEKSQERSAAQKSLNDYRRRPQRLANGQTGLFDPSTGQMTILADAAPKVMRAGDGSTISVGPDNAVTQLVKPPPPKPGKGHGGAAGGSALDKALASLRSDIDPSSGRGAGLFGKDQGLVTSADKVLALIHGEDGKDNYNLTARQMPELVQSVASMLSNGGVAAQAQLEHLMPHTAGMSLADKLEYITGHPEEANAPEFVRQYADTAKRERKLAAQRIRDVQLRRLSAHAGLYGSNPAEAKAFARQYLPDLSEEELDAAFKGSYKAPASTGGVTPTSGAPTHYLVSPDGKMRIQAGPDGKPVPGAKPEPNPAPPKVATRG